MKQLIDWKGLDSGGVEQLWNSEVLLNVLRVFKNNEPFSRNDPQSPIYDDFKELYPEITWSNINADGSFRPIFRKSNPWVKLGLITADTEDGYVTPLGDELISGEKSITEVFVEAAKNHIEADGTRSFALVCKAALEVPNYVFTLLDIEYAIARDYSIGERSIVESLEEVKNSRIQFPKETRRIRTLHSFMDTLVNAKAFVNVSGGWKLDSSEAAKEIYGNNVEAVSTEVVAAEQATPSAKPASTKRQQTTSNLQAKTRTVQIGRKQQTTYGVSLAVADPIKRALLLEKANSIHEQLVQKCAETIIECGFEPIENVDTFDIAIKGKQVLFEAKSIHGSNTISQLRKAIAQLPEYRWKHKEIFEENATQIILTNENPINFVDEDFLQYIQEDRGIKIFWMLNEFFVDSDGQTLQSFLTHHH